MTWSKRYRCTEVFLFGLVLWAFFLAAVGYGTYLLTLAVLEAFA